MPTKDEQIKELWPDLCPECGHPAYIGLSQVKCTTHPKACMNGTQSDYEAYRDIIVADIERAIEETPKFAIRVPEGSVPDPIRGPGIILQYDEDIDEEAETNPGVDWRGVLGKLEERLTLAMRPFGKMQISRCYDRDAFECVLYNPPTNLYIAETFDCSLVEQIGEGFVDWAVKHITWSFPKELNSAWAYHQRADYFARLVDDAIATPPNHVSTGAALQAWFDQEHEIQAEKDSTGALQIGQRIAEYTVVKIDRCRDTFTIAKR